MSLEDFVSVAQHLDQNAGPIELFSGDYATSLWENCDRNIRTLWNKLDNGKKTSFLNLYFDGKNHVQFYQTMRFLDWVYLYLNKALFNKHCAPHIMKQDPESVWREYASKRYFDGLWLLTRVLPVDAVEALKKLASEG